VSATSVKLFAADGKEKGSASLPEELFGQPVREHLLWLSVKRHLGNQRQGTAKVKTRGEVSGGGKKPFRQKGTGRARQGSNTSPLMPGGGRAFGPKPRDYRTEMPSHQRRLALASALSQKASEGAVTVIEDFAMDAPRTAHVVDVLSTLGLGGKKTLLVFGDTDPNTLKSCRNIRNLCTMPAQQLNPYELLRCEALLITTSGLARVKEVFVK
jgi:large subunit ribosomal protein L4